MSRSIKEDYYHTMNRIARLQKKKEDIEEKEQACQQRVKKLVINWIKKNHKDWLAKTTKDFGFVNVIPNTNDKRGEMLVRIYEFTPDTDGTETGEWVNHSIKINEL